MSPRAFLLSAALLCHGAAAALAADAAAAAKPLATAVSPAPRSQQPDDLLARLQQRFAPLRQEWIAVSPDGRYVAYSKRFGPELYVLTADTSAPAHVLASVKVGSEAASEFIAPPPRGADGWNPGPPPTADDPVDTNFRPPVGKREPVIAKMAWVTNSRLVLFTNVNVPKASVSGGLTNRYGAFLAFNADGSHAAMLAHAGDFDGFRAFAPYDAHQVVLQTRPDAAVLMDIFSGHIHSVKFSEWARRNRTRPKPRTAAQVAAALTAAFPDHEIQILDSDLSGDNVAVLVDGATDPGAVGVYRTAAKTLLEFGERQPDLPSSPYAVHRTEFLVAGGRTVQLRLIWSKERPKGHPGIVVICPDGHGGLPVAYSPEVMAFVDMGYPVLQFAIKQSKELAPGEFYDVLQQVRERTGWIDAEYGKLPAEIALVGLTQRASEAAYLSLVRDDGTLRCAVFQNPTRLSDPPVATAAVLTGGRRPSVRNGAYLHDALCLYPAGPTADSADRQMMRAGFCCAPLEKAGTYVDYLPESFGALTLKTKEERALLYSKIEAFLTGALRRARVEIGKEHVVESDRGAPARGPTVVPPPDVKPATPAVDALTAPVPLPSHP